MSANDNMNCDTMREVLLLRCENTIQADEIVAILDSNGIVSRLQDETPYPIVGAYASVSGISVYVFEKDYKSAIEIISPIVGERKKEHPMCPKCGSEDVNYIGRGRDFSTAIAVCSILFLLIPGLYVGISPDLGFRSPLADIIALVMVVVSIVLMFVFWIYNANYKCSRCGRRFRYQRSGR